MSAPAGPASAAGTARDGGTAQAGGTARGCGTACDGGTARAGGTPGAGPPSPDGTQSPGGDTTQAEDAVARAAVDPAHAHAVAAELLARTGDPEVRAVALRALALAAKELGRLDEGIGHLYEAIGTAGRSGHGYRAAQARMSLVGLLAARGDVPAALAAADAAAPVLRGVDAARLLTNRACALSRGGRMDEALATCAAALPRLRAYGDELFLAGTLLNSALIHLYRGEAVRARAGLAEALSIAEAAGYRHLALMARDGLAFAALRAGDLPRALSLYDELEAALTRAGAGERAGQARLGRAQALLAARLPGEARTVLTAALAAMSGLGYEADRAEGRLLLAQAELACAYAGDGDFRAAAGIAAEVRRDCARQGRTGWAVLAEHFAVRARWAADERSVALLDQARDVARRLAAAGWTVAAADSRMVAGRLALALGRPRLARELLAEVAGSRTGGPLAVRVAGWHARALERLGRGDRRAAAAAVRAGLAAVDRHAALLGATELRAHATGWGADLAALGLRLAVTGGRPREVLAWAERGRAVTCRPVSIRPPADPALAAELAELRHVCDRFAAAIGDGADPRPWAALRTRLEGSVRARTRHAAAGAAMPGESRRARDEPAGAVPGMLAAALGDRAFVELFRLDETLFAVTLAGGRCRLWDLGPYGRAVHATRALRFEAHRVARYEAGRAGRGLSAAAARLDARVLGPVRGVLGDRELVIAPVGRLHGLPWPVLPTLSGRPTSVVPSARAWLRARGPDAAPEADGAEPATAAPGGAAGATAGSAGGGRERRIVLAAGPGLTYAEPEIAALRAVYPGATVLTGAAATAGAVRAALDGADLAHLAAHGDFRAGNALFSSLRLADGPLLAYELETLARPPRHVVLAACDAGRGEIHAGESVVGIAGVLLGFGARTVIASVTPVGDAATNELMRGLHRRLAAGATPARALAAVPRPPGAAGFVCFGAG